MRIAIVGGGLFGCTAAIHLAREGHEVHLYERSHALMHGASMVNQLRLHGGWHYPRSPETVGECQASLCSFMAEYADCVTQGRTIYAIATDGSRLTAGEYLTFCERHGLEFRAAPAVQESDALSLAISVREGRIDVDRLQSAVRSRLHCTNVHVHLNTPATRDLRDRFDHIVVAAYAATNAVAKELDAPVKPYQFEIVEKPVLMLPKKYRDFSMVVMDGEFCSIDPFGTSGFHLMGHVRHAIYAVNVGEQPEVPKDLADYLHRGVVINPRMTRFKAFIAAGKAYIPALARAKHIGSMWGIRAVLPNRDHDDARPTLVERLDEQVIRIFSGKLGTACVAAKHVVQMLASSRERRDVQVALAA